MNFYELISQGDGVTRAVAVLLLAMSVASWVVILWKTWLLRRAGTGERIEITHKSASRSTYAEGSLRAVRFLAGRKSGMYDMFDVLGLK